jgi:chromosome segregation ATPase
VRALEAHNATLKADVERLEAQLEKQAADFAARDAERLDLTAERAKTEKAIAAFAQLAERLDALAMERSRPWWRRVVRGA